MATHSTASQAYTAAAEAYIAEQLRLSRFWGFLLSGSLALRDVIQFAIENTKSPAEANERLREQFGLRPGEELRRHDVDYGVHRDLIAEVMLCGLVDNFLTYFVELLALVYARRPEMLRSGD